MQSNDRHRVFKSLESDREFCTRVRTTFPWYHGDNHAYPVVTLSRR